jgi:glycosyltransferase involved in cell wall biosynthesis
MTIPAMAEASLAELAPVKTSNPVTATVPPDAMFVLSTFGVGGSERKIARLANRLADDGVNVVLACMNGPYTLETVVNRGVPVRKLDRTGKFSFAAAWRLRRILVEDRPRTVFAVNLYQALYVALAKLLLPYRPRTVALVNTSTFAGGRLRKGLYQWVLSRFDLTVHGCQAQRRFWMKTESAAGRNSTVIYNGVDSDHFELTHALEEARRLRARLGVKPESLLVGAVGMCRPEKNQQVLLTALRQLRASRVDAHLVIAGDGPLRGQLEASAAQLAIADRVHFIGTVDDVRPVLAALDVFVLPSIAVESFSNAALEAMSMGRPVILSDIGGAREMISDGVEGYVVSPSELGARLPAILAALYADGRKRRQMGIAARARAVGCFSSASMVAGYRGLFHQGEEP